MQLAGGSGEGKEGTFTMLKRRGGWDFFIQIYRSFYGNKFCKPYMVGEK